MRDGAELRPPAGRTEDDTAPVWVLDDPLDSASDQAIAVAERLGVPHLRVPLAWRWGARLLGLAPRGSLRGLASTAWPFTAPRGPALAISAGHRAEAVSLWLRDSFGTRVVHCGRPAWRASQFDLLVVPRHLNVRPASNVLPVLGEPNRLSPLALSQARVSWAGRLSHLPRPLVALLVGGGGHGGEMRPSAAHLLGRQIARMAVTAGGAVLATNTRRTGAEATEALAGGLAPCMHVLYRWGEPGENPFAAMIALADIVVVTGDSPSMISEACAGEAPVLIASSDDNSRNRRLHDTLYRARQARPLGMAGIPAPWARVPLDEAGRVATEIRARMSVGPQAIE